MELRYIWFCPLKCTFSTFYDGNGLNIVLHVEQTADVSVTSHKLNAGVLGDIIDDLTSIVDSKINDLKNGFPRMSADVPFLTLKDASGSTPIMVKGHLSLKYP